MFQDLRLAMRGFARSPGFALVAAVTLALGIGANTAIFSVLSAVLLRPLPYPQADQLVAVGQADAKEDKLVTTSYLDFVEWRQNVKTLRELAAWHDDEVTLTGVEQPERLHGIATSANIFDTLGVRPVLGRGFAAGE